MPIKNDREYRSFEILKRAKEEREEESFIVEGYASTFEEYDLWEDDEMILRERIEPTALTKLI